MTINYLISSNDASGCLVSLLATFLHFTDRKFTHNIVIVASAEEESSEKTNKVFCLLPEMRNSGGTI
jgi:acetylornithine deacetylase